MADYPVIAKRPADGFSVGLDYNNASPTGETLSSASAAVTDETANTDQTSTILVSAALSVSAGVASFRLRPAGGTLGHTYRIDVTSQFSGGGVLQDSIRLVVKDQL